MKITANKNDLIKGISIGDSVISSKNINNILGNCLFNIEKDYIYITGTDNEIAIKTKINAIAEDSFSFAVNGKKFLNILKELPDEEVNLDIDDSFAINIKSKNIKGNYIIYGFSAEEFPVLNFRTFDNIIEIDQAILKDMIKKVIYAAAVDTIKPVFNSVFFEIGQDNSINVVATDSRRLSIISRNIDSSIDDNIKIIAPLKTVNEILRLLGSSGKCKISSDGNQCYFKIDDTEILSRLVDGEYPNVKHIIPKDYISKATIETSLFNESLKRAMIFTKEPVYKILLFFEKDRLRIESNTPDLGKGEEEIAIEIEGNTDINIGINGVFLLDCIKTIDSKYFIVGISGTSSPVTIIPEDDKNHISVVMPIHIKS